MTAPSQPRGVAFAPGETGSTLLQASMARATADFPQVFGDLTVPGDARRFKQELPDLIVRFEARRAASVERVDVARMLASWVPDRALLSDAPLTDSLAAASASADEPAQLQGTARPGWTPEITYRGRTWRGAELGELADRLRADHQLTAAAAAALKWVASELASEPIDLSDQRFVLLGAGAELAPTPYLLAAGARVLWVDRAPPTDHAAQRERFAGTLVHAPAAADLIAGPDAVCGAVAREAEAGPVHLGLYAYAPGKGRELLLTAAMNGIAGALPEGAVASTSMLVSPTTPGEAQPEDQADRRARRASAPRWQRALARLRLLPEPAHHRHGDTEVSRSIVPLQGPTYLAAQYLMKMMTAEAWAVDRPHRVSANVAGITRTKSLEHPLFLAGFLGAPTFGIEIFDADTTRVLTTLLMLHDLLNPDAPGVDATGGPAAQARRVASQSVHGGVRSAPFSLDETIRVAAVLGLTRQPSLLLRLRG